MTAKFRAALWGLAVAGAGVAGFAALSLRADEAAAVNDPRQDPPTVRLATARVAVLQFAYPTVAIVVDWVYFQHTLGAWQMAGVVLMLGAIAAGERGARRNR